MSLPIATVLDEVPVGMRAIGTVPDERLPALRNPMLAPLVFLG